MVGGGGGGGVGGGGGGLASGQGPVEASAHGLHVEGAAGAEEISSGTADGGWR